MLFLCIFNIHKVNIALMTPIISYVSNVINYFVIFFRKFREIITIV